MITDDKTRQPCPACKRDNMPREVWTDTRDRDEFLIYRCTACRTEWHALAGAPALALGTFTPQRLDLYDIEREPLEIIDLDASS